MTTPTPADDARAIIDNLRRQNIAVICHDEAAVAAMVDAHQALRAENEALRAEVNRVHGESNRVMKTLIAGQERLQAQIEQLQSAAVAVCDAPNVGLCIAAIGRLRQIVKENAT